MPAPGRVRPARTSWPALRAKSPKELETLERIAERIDKLTVFGGLDQVLNSLVKAR